ncbi:MULTISPECIES: porin [unclassified Janthinobacterium]|uniref:porin n=1 Tax=unclassified Janthinobacterium TaxID=2610881 RepID=UPI0003483975|nr:MULTISPECIES: porin [unclassified Janthinobacterium]MEC5163003.1 putative porin [Janthinobacterium sp. CG_S6]
MKKTLLALAVLASIAGVASAQSSVTIYGVVDAGITRETGAIAGAVTKLSTGVQSGNRLGFKGTEDLGGGLKANFQLENGFDLDTGAQRQGGRLFGRQAWVGLSGAFGAVNLGRQYNPIFLSMDAIDPFGTGLSGATTNLMSAGTVRVDNAITYSMPAINGFTATALFGAGESSNGNKVNAKAGASVDFNKGPLLVTAAWNKVASNSAIVGSNGTEDILVGATYNFGPVTAHAAYETEEVNDGKTAKYRDFMVGASVPVGPGSFLASYIDKNDRMANSKKGAKQIAVGYLYSLSKRTNLYTSYARIKNEAGARNYVSDASSGGVADASKEQALGSTSSAFSVGLRHKF